MTGARATRRTITRFALYGEGAEPVDAGFVHVERIFDRSSRHDWTIEPHAHPGLVQLLVLLDGQALLASEAEQRAVEGPGAFLVPAGVVHGFRFRPGVEGWVLSFAAALLDDPRAAGFVAALDLAREAPAWADLSTHPAEAERMGAAMRDLDARLAAVDPAPGAVLAQVLLVLAIFAGLTRAPAGNGASDPRGRLAARLRALIELHYREHWSVADYAAALGTTRATLTRAARERFGRAPAELAHDRLMLEARRLLAFTDSPVAVVADALGFADPAYFARFFKERSGSSARHFRASRGWPNAATAPG